MIIWLVFAYRNIFRNKRRSLMALAMIATAVSTMLLAGGFVNYSFKGLAESTVRADTGSMQIANKKTFENVPFSKEMILSDTTRAELSRILDSNPQVDYYFDITVVDGLLSSGELSRSVIVKATDIQAQVRLSSVFSPIVRGSIPTNLDENPFSAMIGENLAKSLSLNIGDSITILVSTIDGGINAIDLSVVAFLKTGIPDVDSRMVIIPRQALAILQNNDAVQTRIVVLKDLLNVESVMAEINEKLINDNNIVIKSWEDMSNYYKQVKDIYGAIFIFFFVMIFIMMLISISNTMMVVVFERVKEIGTMRSFGFSKKQLSINFTLEALLMGIMGFFIGLLSALFISYILNNVVNIVMPPPPGMTKGYPLAIDMDFMLILLVFVVIIIVTLLSSIAPVRLATKIKIVEALGHV